MYKSVMVFECVVCGQEIGTNKIYPSTWKCPACDCLFTFEDSESGFHFWHPKTSGLKVPTISIYQPIREADSYEPLPSSRHTSRVDSQLEIGLKAMDQGMYGEAAEAFEFITAILPKRIDYYEGLAQAYYCLGLVNKLNDVIERALHNLTNAPHSLFCMGNIFNYAGDEVMAIDLYTKAISRQPDFTNALFNRGLLHFNKGRTQQALLDIDQVIHYQPQSDAAYNLRGQITMNMGHYDLSIADFITSIKLNPNNPSVYNNRANAFFRLRWIDSALADYDMAIKLAPDLLPPHVNKAHLLMHEGYNYQALDVCNAALARDPNVVILRVYRKIIVVLLEQDTTASLLEHFERVCIFTIPDDFMNAHPDLPNIDVTKAFKQMMSDS
jgi:tetratricopeptide (TPR) repeat protein